MSFSHFNRTCILLWFGASVCLGLQPKHAVDWFVDHQWKLKENPASSASLASTGDGFSIQLKQSDKTPILITCVAPVPISTDAKRLNLWLNPAVMGNLASWKVSKFSLFAKVTDARGNTYRFPFSTGGLSNRGWGRLSTEDLSLCPAARPWEKHPQPPLALTGIEIHPGPGAVQEIQLHGLCDDREDHVLPARPWQIASLANSADRDAAFSWAGVVGVEYTAQGWQDSPQLTLDAVLSRPGTYTLGIRMREQWQGPIIKEWSQNIVLPATDFETEKRQPLLLPTPHPGTYFLEIRSWNQDAVLLGIKSFLLLVPDVKGVPPASAATGQGGFLALQRTSPSAAGGKLSLDIAVKIPAGTGEKKIHVLLTDYQFHPLKEQTLDFPDGIATAWQTRVDFPDQIEEACRAFVELSVGRKVVDKDSLVLGNPARQKVHGSSAGSAPCGERFFCGVTSSSFLVNAVPPAGLDTLARVSRGMDQAVLSGNQIVELEMPWRDLEPLPELFQFSLLDKMLDLAQAKGLKILIAPWYLSGHAPHWIFPHVACYEDGSSLLVAGTQFMPSPSDPVVQQAIARLWKTLARRYQGHPALAGYLACGPGLDLGYWHTGLSQHTDYSPSVATRFQQYLRDIRHETLAGVCARYGRMFSSWEEVLPPRPNWEGDFDLRPQWVDFCAYQQWELHQWMEGNFQAIRGEDPVHAIYQYQYVGYGPQEYYYPLFKKYRVAVTTGGTEGTSYHLFVSTYNLWGLRSRGGETIQTVTKWNLYGSLFNMLSHGGDGAYYEVQWHDAFPEPWDTKPEGANNLQEWSKSPSAGWWLLRVKENNFHPDFVNCSKILKDMGDTQPLPLEAGSLYSWAGNFYQYRWMNPYGISGEALSKAWMEKEHRQPRWITDYTPLELFRNLKLLVVDSDIPVMSRATAENLTAYAKNGGCLVTFAPTGKYTVETGKPDFGFLSGLGFCGLAQVSEKAEGTTVVGTPFFQGEKLFFKNLYTTKAPPGAEILQTASDGTPCVLRLPLGLGEVILFLGSLDWEQSGHILSALCRHRKIPQWCDSTNSVIQLYALQQGETRYIVVRYPIYSYGKPLEDFVGKQTAQTVVKAYHLAAPGYSVSELFEGHSLGNFSPKQLESGLEMQLKSGETKILKYSPMNPNKDR